MSKQTKRKITVELSKSELPKARPSVFERLGTKASTQEFCRHWAQNGTCPYGKTCKYANTHTLTSPSKQRAAIKGKDVEKKLGRKDDGKRLHSTIVKALRSPETEWGPWDPTDLEEADAEMLEKRRQELKRELELQMKMDSKMSKKDKKIKKRSSSSSSNSSSSTSDSSSSSEDSSSTSSSTSMDSRKRKKRSKKRDSSSSSEPERRSKKKLAASKSHKHLKVSETNRKKTQSPLPKKTKSPSPSRSRRLSQTPPPKPKSLAPIKTSSKPRSPKPPESNRKEKNHTPSPKISRSRERDSHKDRDKDRDNREKEKEREKEREREKDKREKDRMRSHESRKSPNKRGRSRDPKKKDSPDSGNSRKSPVRGRGSTKRDKTPDRRSDRKKDSSRDLKDRSLERRDKNNSRDKDHDRSSNRDRDRIREEREKERELAREKEREEALARCQERQRERERLKEMHKKDREIPSLLHINTSNEYNKRDRNDRSLDRRQDKPNTMMYKKDNQDNRSQDHSRDNRNRDNRGNRGRGNADRMNPDRRDKFERDDRERPLDNRDRGNYEHRPYERDNRYDRDYIPPRRDDRRNLDEKNYDSPYDRNRRDDRGFVDMEHEHFVPEPERRMSIDSREYGPPREWDQRIEPEIDPIEPENNRRRPYVREDSRPPNAVKNRQDWENQDYNREWNNRGGRGPPPHETWERPNENSEQGDRASIDEEWRHYNSNRSMDSWQGEENRRPQRWPEFPERTRSVPKSISSQRDEDEVRRPIEVIKPVEVHNPEVVPPIVHEPPPEPKKETILGKRPSESIDEAPEVKKPCVEEPPMDDDLSEISDDADEILNREDVEDLIEPAEEIPQILELMEVPPEPIEELPPQVCVEKPQPIPHEEPIIESVEKSQSSVPGSRESAFEEDGIENMGFEEISDEELEEETKIKGIGDALGVDWASLVAESRPKIKTENSGSAKKRWESLKVLSRVGISLEMAGKELIDEIISDIKKENQEDVSEENKIDPEKLFSHPVAAIQVANREKSIIRNNLFASAGLNRRAMSARRDLAIRRHLCGLPIKDLSIDRPKTPEISLFEQAKQLVLKCV